MFWSQLIGREFPKLPSFWVKKFLFISILDNLAHIRMACEPQGDRGNVPVTPTRPHWRSAAFPQTPGNHWPQHRPKWRRRSVREGVEHLEACRWEKAEAG
eukprot:g41469.t1